MPEINRSNQPHPSVQAEVPLKVLVVDDAEANRMVLQAILEKQGHRVVAAGDGAQAVAAFQREQPDMVLMDIMMPVMDGYEATRRIKELAGDDFVPVIFVTALRDDQSLAKCVEYGGNDFLSKPYNHVIIKAKVDAFRHLRQLYQTVRAQRDTLAEHDRLRQREYEVAEGVVAKLTHSSALHAPNIRYLLSPQAMFNGDLALAAYRPSGALNLMLGDFTGHGLSAAVGTIPVSDIFYGMTAKGFSIAEIAPEINYKLGLILPKGLFLAACLVEVDYATRRLSVWNGGIPEVLLYGKAQGGIRHRFASRHFPLGLVDSDTLEPTLETVTADPGDRVVLYTDGVVEARNPQGEMFGQQRLEQCLNEPAQADAIFEEITGQLSAFVEGGQQSDDVTLIEIACQGESARDIPAESVKLRHARPATSWKMGVEFGPETLSRIDPLPILVQSLMEVQGLHQHKHNIYVILAELFSNALDHGVLGLDSSLKCNPEGFDEYYRQRGRKLAALTEGWIRIDLEHAATGPGGRLIIRVEDSGRGFPYRRKASATEANTAYHGRGIPLIESLCERLVYRGCGNCAEVTYAWNVGDGSVL